MRFSFVHRLEPRRLFAAVAVGDLSVSDIPDRAGADQPGVVVGDVYYFPVQWERGRSYFPPALSPQLFRSDGTPNGTFSVKAFSFDYQLTDLTAIGQYVYFGLKTATNYIPEIWRSDGTAAGTQRIAEQTSLNSTPNGAEFIGLGGDVYFGSGGGLWRLPAGATVATRLKADQVYAMTVLGNQVLFLTTTGLWKTDGTPAGTAQVKQLGTAYFSRSLVTLGGTAYFDAGSQLYRTDGTASGTQPVMGTTPFGQSPPYISSALVTSGDALFFRGSDGTSPGGDELWRSDGTVAGTSVVKDIRPDGPSSPSDLTTVGNSIYFTADDGTHGRELWKTDGTREGTALVADLTPGSAGTPLRMLTAALGRLYFTFADPAVGQELFLTDGTSGGTHVVSDLIAGTSGTLVQQITPGASRVFFTGVDPAYGYSAFVADERGAAFAGDILPGLLNVRYGTAGIAATSTGDVYYADGDLTPTGREPHVIPQGGSERIAADLQPGGDGSDPQNFISAGDQVLFRAATTETGVEVWRAGDSAMSLLKDVIPPDADSSSVSMQGPFNGNVFINYAWTVRPVPPDLSQSSFTEKWISQGTADTTVKRGNGSYVRMVEMGDWLYYLTNSYATQATLGRTALDLSAGQIVKTVPSVPLPYAQNGIAADLHAIGSLLYFYVLDGGTGRELWRSDGTAAGTFIVKDIAPGSKSSAMPGIAQLRGNIGVFAASPDSLNVVPSDLWMTDGTGAGTVKLLDTRPGMHGANPRDFVHFNDSVIFTADDGLHGRELWKTDGTTAGTVLVKDIVPGSGGSAPTGLKVVGSKVYFVATDNEGGQELWTSDGTAAGTVRVDDINPGPGSSDPTNLTDIYGDLYFTANDGTGPKLYRVAHPPPTVTGRHVFYNNSSFDGRSADASASDDGAIAPDKQALLPGQRASFSNVTSYTRGINGVMIDLAGRPPRSLRPEDFDIRIGRSGSTDQWESGPPPQSVSVRLLSNGIDRTTLTWPDGLLRNTWVRVTVKADWNTGLSEPDVFYFGNSVGAAGLTPDGEGTIASAADYIRNRRTTRHLALPTDVFDFDRNGVVNVLDLLASRRALMPPTVLSLVLS